MKSVRKIIIMTFAISPHDFVKNFTRTKSLWNTGEKETQETTVLYTKKQKEISSVWICIWDEEKSYSKEATGKVGTTSQVYKD